MSLGLPTGADEPRMVAGLPIANAMVTPMVFLLMVMHILFVLTKQLIKLITLN